MAPLEIAAKAITTGEVWFYAASFALAVAAGLVRTWSDNRFRDFWNLLSIGFSAGFVGLGCVALVCWRTGSSIGHQPGLVALAIFVGLLGKEATKLPPLLADWILRKVGVEVKDEKEDP